jgi:Transposase DDE domain
MGGGTKTIPCITMRLVEIRAGKTWYSYLTSVLDPLILPPYVVADLYGRRWRIEEAFNTVKRLLGLSYSLPTQEIDAGTKAKMCFKVFKIWSEFIRTFTLSNFCSISAMVTLEGK